MGSPQCLDLWIKVVITNGWCDNINGIYHCPATAVYHLYYRVHSQLLFLEACEKTHHAAVRLLHVASSFFFFASFPSHQLRGGLNKRCGAGNAVQWQHQVFIALCSVQVTVIISRWQWQSPIWTRWWFKGHTCIATGVKGARRRVEKARIKVEECKSTGALESGEEACSLHGRMKPQKEKPHVKAAWKQKKVQVKLGSAWCTERVCCCETASFLLRTFALHATLALKACARSV